MSAYTDRLHAWRRAYGRALWRWRWVLAALLVLAVIEHLAGAR